MNVKIIVLSGLFETLVQETIAPLESNSRTHVLSNTFKYIFF